MESEATMSTPRRGRLGLALLLIAVSSLVAAPALAAPLAPSSEGEVRSDDSPSPGTTRPNPCIATINTSTPNCKADLRVTYLGESAQGNVVTYEFEVENLGYKAASVELLWNWWATNGRGANVWVNKQWVVDGWAVGQSQTFAVTCDPGPGGTCSHAELGAEPLPWPEADLHPDDNGAHSPIPV
jgi:hypothetical protein